MQNPLKRLMWWFHRWVESSFEQQLDLFDMFTQAGKEPRRHRKVLISPTKRLVWGTELAVLVFLCLVGLQALSIVYLREFKSDLMVALFVVLSFLAGTYWGHKG